MRRKSTRINRPPAILYSVSMTEISSASVFSVPRRESWRVSSWAGTVM
jgi:hypothetical protein